MELISECALRSVADHLRSEDGENTEYDRALDELLAYTVGNGEEDLNKVRGGGSTNVTVERGVAFFADGSEVSNVHVDLIKVAPEMLKIMKHIWRNNREHFGKFLPFMSDGLISILINEE
jgi:hypothetical protein